VLLESTTLKQAEGEPSTLDNAYKLYGHRFHISFSCIETRHNKKAIGKDPMRCDGCPWHAPMFRRSEALCDMTKTQHNEVLKSSWGFSELSR